MQMDGTRQERKKIKKRTKANFRTLVTLKSNLIILIYYSTQSIIMNKNNESFFDYIEQMRSWEVQR